MRGILRKHIDILFLMCFDVQKGYKQKIPSISFNAQYEQSSLITTLVISNLITTKLID